jgi:hypothetical protein
MIARRNSRAGEKTAISSWHLSCQSTGMRGLLLVMLGAICIGGCSSAAAVPDVSQQAPQRWVARHGGLHDGEQAERAQRAAGRFSAVLPHPPSAHVLASSELAAWSWPSGEIYLTLGLTDLLSDDELAAVISHELGHLDLPLKPPGALAEAKAPADIECRADARGAALLALSGQSAAALRSALGKLMASNKLSKSVRSQLQRRIEALPR